MTLQVTTTVTEVEIKGPLTSATGEFDLHVYKTPSGEFTKAAKLNAPTEAKAGDTIEVFYDEATGKKGRAYNKVLKLQKTGEGLLNPNPISKSQAKRFASQSNTNNSGMESKAITNESKSSPAQTGFTTFSNKSARIGGLLHDAVQIALHNAAVRDEYVSVGDVISLAKELLGEVEKHLD